MKRGKSAMHRALWVLIIGLFYAGFTPARALIIQSNPVTNDTRCADRAKEGVVDYIASVGNGCFDPAKPADVQKCTQKVIADCIKPVLCNGNMKFCELPDEAAIKNRIQGECPSTVCNIVAANTFGKPVMDKLLERMDKERATPEMCANDLIKGCVSPYCGADGLTDCEIAKHTKERMQSIMEFNETKKCENPCMNVAFFSEADKAAMWNIVYQKVMAAQLSAKECRAKVTQKCLLDPATQVCSADPTVGPQTKAPSLKDCYFNNINELRQTLEAKCDTVCKRRLLADTGEFNDYWLSDVRPGQKTIDECVTEHLGLACLGQVQEEGGCATGGGNQQNDYAACGINTTDYTLGTQALKTKLLACGLPCSKLDYFD